MMMIQKTEEQRDRILKFILMFADIIETAGNHEDFKMQEMFNVLRKELFITSGTTYLCFTCKKIVPRKEIGKNEYFQLKGIWHGCRDDMNMNGYIVPTIGIITRWKTVLKYLDDNDIE